MERAHKQERSWGHIRVRVWYGTEEVIEALLHGLMEFVIKRDFTK